MAESSTETQAPEEAVRMSSVVTLKRTSSVLPWAKGAYGKRGIVALTDTRLFFFSQGSSGWEFKRSDITNVKKPWYGMGTYVSFEVRGAYYGLSFDNRSAVTAGAIGSVAFDAGAVGMAVLSDAVAVARLRRAAHSGAEWFAALGGGR
ncbi:MAG TPA: hypothetical protein VHX66_10155 [Solirubrobacteraceae bacterium]|jgi:hypothetical protein|nr:hypothetical protein [Solirubrobacteraceae bacterium]